MSSADKISKWKNESEIDWFSYFIKAWFCFDAWYKSNDEWGCSTDREYIKHISTKNNKFTKYINELLKLAQSNSNLPNKDKIKKFVKYTPSQSELLSNLENFKKSLDFANLINRGQRVSFENAICNSIVERKNLMGSTIDIGNIKFIENIDEVVCGVINILYEIRCLLFHGDIVPDENTRKVYKYGYLILFQLINESGI